MTKAWTNPGSPPWVPDLVVTDTHLDTHVSDNLDYLGGADGRSGSVGVGTPVFVNDTSAEATTTSTSYVDITAAYKGTVITKGGDLLVTMSLQAGNTSSNGTVSIGLGLNGTADTEVGRIIVDYNGFLQYRQVAAVHRYQIPAGTHVISGRYKAVNGNAYTYGPRNMLLTEVRSG